MLSCIPDMAIDCLLSTGGNTGLFWEKSHIWISYLYPGYGVAHIYMTLRNRQIFEKDCMDLRKTEKNKRGKCCIGGLWGLLLAFSSVILTDCLYFHHCCGNGFCIFYFFIGKPGRTLLTFQDVHTAIDKHRSKLWAPEDSWNQ